VGGCAACAGSGREVTQAQWRGNPVGESLENLFLRCVGVGVGGATEGQIAEIELK
jgi:hypothetical protein